MERISPVAVRQTVDVDDNSETAVAAIVKQLPVALPPNEVNEVGRGDSAVDNNNTTTTTAASTTTTDGELNGPSAVVVVRDGSGSRPTTRLNGELQQQRQQGSVECGHSKCQRMPSTLPSMVDSALHQIACGTIPAAAAPVTLGLLASVPASSAAGGGRRRTSSVSRGGAGRPTIVSRERRHQRCQIDQATGAYLEKLVSVDRLIRNRLRNSLVVATASALSRLKNAIKKRDSMLSRIAVSKLVARTICHDETNVIPARGNVI
jgi:hypothetical protein